MARSAHAQTSENVGSCSAKLAATCYTCRYVCMQISQCCRNKKRTHCLRFVGVVFGAGVNVGSDPVIHIIMVAHVPLQYKRPTWWSLPRPVPLPHLHQCCSAKYWHSPGMQQRAMPSATLLVGCTKKCTPQSQAQTNGCFQKQKKTIKTHTAQYHETARLFWSAIEVLLSSRNLAALPVSNATYVNVEGLEDSSPYVRARSLSAVTFRVTL